MELSVLLERGSNSLKPFGAAGVLRSQLWPGGLSIFGQGIAAVQAARGCRDKLADRCDVRKGVMLSVPQGAGSAIPYFLPCLGEGSSQAC